MVSADWLKCTLCSVALMLYYDITTDVVTTKTGEQKDFGDKQKNCGVDLASWLVVVDITTLTPRSDYQLELTCASKTCKVLVPRFKPILLS